MINDETGQPGAPPAVAEPRDLEGEAMRRRIASRLFGAAFEAVWLGRFRIIEALGAGGMGVVHAAEDTKLDRRVAIKVLRDERLRNDPQERARLLREARALAKLSHPNVVQVHEVGEHDGGVFIVMELVRGATLREWLATAPRSLAEIIARFVEAGEGLAAAHRVGVVHRDFKPANVLVGEDGRLRIVDFGLARGVVEAAPDTVPEAASAAASVSAPGVPATMRPAGTPGYMSPEQALGEACDARSDQFSFC